MPPDTLAPPAPVRTFHPTQRIVGRELRGARGAVELECGHLADLPAAEALMITTRCATCAPVEVLPG